MRDYEDLKDLRDDIRFKDMTTEEVEEMLEDERARREMYDMARESFYW